MYTVYVLQSLKYWRYYIWYSSNINERLLEHNNWNVRSTKFYIPYKIKYTENFENKTDALKREKELKKMKSNNNFKIIINAGIAQG
jgi:putative endonuclease